MRNGFLASSVTVLALSGFARAQGYYPPAYYPGYQAPQAYQQAGYQQAAYQPNGYPGTQHAAFQQAAYPQQSYVQPGYAQPGYAQSSYAQPSYSQAGHQHPGYPPPMPYAQPPRYPMYLVPRPVIHGWPPPQYAPAVPAVPAPAPGPFTPPAPVQPAPFPGISQTSEVLMPPGEITTVAAIKPANNSVTPAVLPPASQKKPAAAPAAGRTLPVQAMVVPSPGAACDSCQAGPPGVAPMVSPTPGSPLVCQDGNCGACGHDGGCATCNSCPGGACSPCAGACGPCAAACGACIEHKHPCSVPHGYSCFSKVEFLYWFFKNPDSVPLFKVGNRQGGFDYLTDNNIDNQERLGVRANVGYWLNHQHTLGVEVGGFYLFERNPERPMGGFITRPYANVTTGADAELPVSGNGFNGSARMETDFRLWGADLNLRYELYRFSHGHIDLLGGFRYLQLEEGLRIYTDSTFGLGVPMRTTDIFSTENQFLGGQVGLEVELNSGIFFFNSYAKFAAGNNRQEVNISGSQSATVGGVAQSSDNGFLAQPSNIGSYRRDAFTIVPEAGFTLGVKLNHCLRIYGGYSILFLLDAVRPGDQIDNSINTTQSRLPGAAAPVSAGLLSPFFDFQSAPFWAQGGHVGLEFRY